jgi:uncharacterized membrane protein
VVSGVINLGVGTPYTFYGIKALGSQELTTGVELPPVQFHMVHFTTWATNNIHGIDRRRFDSARHISSYETENKGNPCNPQSCIARDSGEFRYSDILVSGITLMNVAVEAANVTSIEANYAIVTVRIASLGLLLLSASPLIDRDRGFLKIKRRDVALLCIGGLIANGVGWLMMNYSFTQIMASQAIPISSTSPLFAALAGFVLFHEKATLKTVLGGVAVVAGVALIFIM